LVSYIANEPSKDLTLTTWEHNGNNDMKKYFQQANFQFFILRLSEQLIIIKF